MKRRYARIVSTGVYVPPIVMTPEEFKEKTGIELDEAFIERTGIKVKRIAPEDETPSTMAAKACKQALDRAGLKISDIDLIILGTDTPDFLTPPTSARLQELLGGSEYEIPVFDVNASCANGAYMLEIASSMIMSSEEYNNVLVVGTYCMNRFLRWKFPWEWMFSDGAGAVLLSVSEEPGYIAGKLRADGRYWDYWGIYFGAHKKVEEQLKNKEVVFLDLRKVYPPVNDEYWPKLVRCLMEKGGFTGDDITQIIFTQVRLRSILKVMDALGLPHSKTHWVMHKYGYTGSACAYMALDDAWREGKIEEGKIVIVVTSGVGYEQGAVAFRWVGK